MFPHGIDVLRKTDFYSVSVRRNAFLIAAPQVAEWVVVVTLSLHLTDCREIDTLNIGHSCSTISWM